MLSQQHRRTIHQKLAPIVGEEEVDALLSEFHAAEPGAPATRADLEAHAAATRADLQAMRVDVRATRVELEASIAGVRSDLRAEMHDLGRQMVMWSTGSVIAGMGLAATIGALFGG